jgi:hypothetical protein
LLVLGFKLADAMLFSGRRFADVGSASGLFIGLGLLSPNGFFAELHVAADIAQAQALYANHLHDLQLELRVE